MQILVLAGGQNYLHVCHHGYQQPPLLSVTSSMLLTSGERVRRLQEQCEARIEHLVRKTTSLAKVIFKYLHNIYNISPPPGPGVPRSGEPVRGPAAGGGAGGGLGGAAAAPRAHGHLQQGAEVNSRYIYNIH